jgi:hypothetical protein
MVGQQQHDGDNFPPDTKERKRGGLILAEDDLNSGDYICVYDLKHSPEEGAAILGQSMFVQAICLPYIVCQLLSDPAEPVLTLDCRFLHFMKVSEDFVKAQKAGAAAMATGKPMQVMKNKRKNPIQE